MISKLRPVPPKPKPFLNPTALAMAIGIPFAIYLWDSNLIQAVVSIPLWYLLLE